jgi:transcriptional regulator with XRE-family HTH domain
MIAEMPLTENFRHNLRNRRKELGLTQAAVAERLGVSRERIAQVEAGEGSPSLDLVERFAVALRCSPVTLLLDSELATTGK